MKTLLRTMAVMVVLGAGAQADSITQTANFQYQTVDTKFDYLQPFSPGLGTLTEVDISYGAQIETGSFYFQNTSDQTQSLNATTSIVVSTRYRTQTISNTFPATLNAFDFSHTTGRLASERDCQCRHHGRKPL